MKRLLGLVFVFAMCILLQPLQNVAQSADNTKTVSEYKELGHTAGYLVQDAIDNSSLLSNQIKRRIYIENIDFTNRYGATDSMYNMCVYVPAGSTRSFDIDSVYLYSWQEGDIDSVQGIFYLMLMTYDASAVAYDTLVDQTCLDAESLAYGVTPYLLTMNTTSYDGQLNPGDFVLARFFRSGPWVAEPKGLSLIFIGKFEE
jgi:hypothetical protein